MERVKVYETTIWSANVLRVAAGTTGFRGGDSGHGGRTYIEIEDLGGTDITCTVSKDGRKLEIEIGGDTELATIIQGLDFIVDTLRKNCGTDPNLTPWMPAWETEGAEREPTP